MKLCETCFLSKKNLSKIFFFKNWNFYSIGGSELVKNFEKWGWKMFLLFFRLHHIWGSELVKMFGKFGWKMFLRVCGFYLIWGSELVKMFGKFGWKMFLRVCGFYLIWGSELAKIFEKRCWNFFCVFSALVNVKLCKISFLSKKSCRKSFFSNIEIFTLQGDQNS